jgi:hypothetical protein
MSLLVNTNANTSAPALPAHGFGEFEVPEMPAYVQSYSSRGSGFSWATTPVQNQSRFGNRAGVGGMGAYLSMAEDPNFLEGNKQKLGAPGVFRAERWGPGYDWRGNGGIASLEANKNWIFQTRGGQLRAGGPRRSDTVDRPNYWLDTVRPGVQVSREAQNNDNYAGTWEWKRQTPIVERESDFSVLRQMIEHNPYAIVSHAALQAKAQYDSELDGVRDEWMQPYNPDIARNTAAFGNRTIRDLDPRVENTRWL